MRRRMRMLIKICLAEMKIEFMLQRTTNTRPYISDRSEVDIDLP